MIDGFLGDRLKERCNLRIRHDVVFISCVLFTIALVCLIPPVWDHVLTGYGDLRRLNPDMRAYVRSDSEVGKLSLALILIGLIVTWTGYLNKVRWTWFVMFILVFGLAIPLGILPLVVHPGWVVEAVSDFILEAAEKKPGTIPWGLWRSLFETISIFLLMVIALFLPVKSFFFRRTGPAM
jgi:hypothetical protein